MSDRSRYNDLEFQDDENFFDFEFNNLMNQESKDLNFQYEESDMNFELEDNIQPKTNKIPPGSFVPSHLAMPITNDDIKFLLENDKFYCLRHKIIKEKLNTLKISNDIYNIPEIDAYRLLENFIEGAVKLNTRDERANLEEHISISFRSLEVHKVDFFGKSGNPGILNKLKIDINSKLDAVKSYVDRLIESFVLMKKVEYIKDKICSKRIPFGEFIELNNELLVERDIFIIKYSTHHWTIGPTTLLLCVLDIHQSRFPKMFYWLLADIHHKYPISMIDTGCKLIDIFESLRIKLKNDFFKFISTWESFVLGFVINDSENDLGFHELYDTSLETMKELLSSNNITFDLSILLPPNRETDVIKLYIELLGNTKHFGHPCLEVKSGFDNVRKYGTEIKGVDLEVAKLGSTIMRRDFVKNFLLKKGKWPPCVSVPPAFSYFYKKGKYPTMHERDYNLWELVKFSKTFDYDTSPDTSELIKDSAAANEYDTWYAEYDPCAFKILYGKSKPKVPRGTKPTRVIQRYLTGNEYDVEKKIFELSNSYFDPQDSTAVLCRKEQELKPDGRLFVKQPYNQRLGQTSMESNIAHQFMRYMPEQTMTNGEIQLMRRLTETAKSQKAADIEILNLDLSKWNMRFRHGLVLWYGQILDELFDTKELYTNNHIWFLTANVFCNSRLAPPDYDENLKPIPGDYYYNNQLGGMEGMRQKLWTIITVCLIKLAAEKVKLNINIMCQGDNQVVMLNYGRLTSVQKAEKRTCFLSTLEKTLESVNLILKKEETWFSTRLCEFGKVRYYDGEAISNCDKKINRCIPDINDGVCSFMSSLSTINTITESTAKCDFTADISFVINQFMILNYLHRKSVFSKNMKDYEKMAFLYHPTDFGGISLSTYFSHTIRGYDDKLTLWLSLLKTLRSLYPRTFIVTKSLNNAEPKFGDINYSKLVEDIFSLNIINLPSVENKMKNLALSYLTSHLVTNPEVTKIFKSSSNKSKDDIVNSLISMKPFIPSLAHELLRNSNTGILLSLRNQFSNLTTINKIIQELTPNSMKELTRDIIDLNDKKSRDTPYDFLDIANKNNKKVVSILKRRIKRYSSSFLDHYLSFSCPTEASNELRHHHWKLDILGSSKPYPPCQFRLMDLDYGSPLELEKSILLTLSDDFASRSSVNFLKDGPFLAYLGSATKEKVKKPTMDIAVRTSFTKSLQQLHLIKSWCNRMESTNLIKLVDDLIKEKDSIIPEELDDFDIEDWCAMVWGGNILHRFRSMIEKNASVINFLPTQATHIKQTTNNLSSITSGGRDFTIHFQMILIYNIINTSLIKEYSYLNVKQFCSVLSCPGCTKEVTHINVDLESYKPLPSTDADSKIHLRESLSIQDLKYSRGEIIYSVSIHLGRIFGKSSDILYLQGYIVDKVITSRSVNHETMQISINDLRYIDYQYFIPALISSSNIIKESLIRYTSAEMMFQRAQFLEAMCTMLSNAKMIEDLLMFLDVPLREHYQGLDSKLTSSIIFFGLYKWAHKNLHNYSTIFIEKIFVDDDDYFIYNNQRWIQKFLIRSLKNNKISIILKKCEINWNQLEINKDKIKDIIKCQNFYTLNRRMLRERAIFYLRSNMSESFLPPIRTVQKIIKVSTVSNDITSSTFFVLFKRFLCDLTELKIGEDKFKDLHQIARPHGQISTSINKILEILLLTDTYNQHMSNIYCLAEGSGSIIEGLGTIYPESNLFYNSLMDPLVDMRSGADQDYPPSVLSSKKIEVSRIKNSMNLSKGETDITTAKFISKLEGCFSLYPPSLVTMDAESNERASNLNIFFLHLPYLIKNNVKLAIYKAFVDCNNVPNFVELMNLYPNYFLFLIKPISSNFNNPEVYLIICQKAILKENKFCELYQCIEPTVKNMNTNKLSTKSSFGLFLAVSSKRNEIILRIFNNLSRIDDKLILFSDERSCSLFCKSFIKDLTQLLLKLHNFDHSETTLYLIIRNGGISQNITRIFLLLVSILCVKHCSSVKEALYSLMSVPINAYIRDGTLFEKKPISDYMYDWKWFLRTVSIDMNYNIKNCHCRYTAKDIVIFKEFKISPFFKNLGVWFEQLGFNNIDLFKFLIRS